MLSMTFAKTFVQRSIVCLGLLIFVLALPLESLRADLAVAAGKLTGPAVVEKMITMNQQRADALRGYVSVREYYLEFHGLGIKKTAQMAVKMTYRQPDQKEFTILSKQGSKLLLKRVLEPIVESEVEAMQNGNFLHTSVTPENYDFTLVGFEQTPERNLYVLEAEPKVDNRFLFRGRVWVDSQEFAIVRIEAEPAKNPSWWIKKTTIHHRYSKIGDFWLPAEDTSVSKIRLFGRAVLTIDYQKYELKAGAESASKDSAKPTNLNSLSQNTKGN